MNVSMTPALLQQPQFVPVVTGAEPLVRDEIATAAANAEWDYAVDERARPLLVLKLSDGLDGRASARFAPGELAVESHFRERLHDLQGALHRVGDWCHDQLPALYHDIRQWVAALQPASFMQDTVVQINERLSGPYEAPALDIARGNRVVHVRPVAIWVVAADGRVDLVGPMDRYILMLRDGDWYAADPPGRPEELPLTSEVFRILVESMME